MVFEALVNEPYSVFGEPSFVAVQHQAVTLLVSLLCVDRGKFLTLISCSFPAMARYLRCARLIDYAGRQNAAGFVGNRGDLPRSPNPVQRFPDYD